MIRLVAIIDLVGIIIIMFGCLHDCFKPFKLDILLFFNFRQILAMISIFITISQMIWE